MFRSGKLRHRITIESPTETRDSIGDPVATWSTYAIRWAAIEPINGREFFSAQQQQSEITARFRLRWDSVVDGITAKMRATWSGRTFEIDSVIRPEERNREVILMCTERGI